MSISVRQIQIHTASRMRIYKLISFIVLLSTSSLASHASPVADAYAAMGITPAGAPRPAPSFVLTDLNGIETRLADLKGKLILLNFWATWCEPCRKEMPDLERLWQTYRHKGLVVLAVSEDGGDTRSVTRFVAKHRLSYTVSVDRDGELATRYQVSGLPATYLIDRQGNIVASVLGSKDWAGAEAGALIEHLLEK